MKYKLLPFTNIHTLIDDLDIYVREKKRQKKYSKIQLMK